MTKSKKERFKEIFDKIKSPYQSLIYDILCDLLNLNPDDISGRWLKYYYMERALNCGLSVREAQDLKTLMKEIQE